MNAKEGIEWILVIAIGLIVASISLAYLSDYVRVK